MVGSLNVSIGINELQSCWICSVERSKVFFGSSSKFSFPSTMDGVQMFFASPNCVGGNGHLG